MKKIKTILFYCFVVASLSAAIWGYFYLKQNKKPSLNALDVLPDHPSSVFSTANFHELVNKLCNQNILWNEIKCYGEFNALDLNIQYFDSIAYENETIKDFLKDRLVFLSVYPSGSLISFNLNDLAHEDDFKEAISKILKCEFNEQNLGEFWNGRRKYYCKINNGVTVVSENAVLLNQCFDNTTPKLKNNRLFKELIKNLDQDDVLNVFINHETIKKSTNKVNIEGSLLDGNSVFSTELSPDAITLNGFNESDSTSQFNMLDGQPLISTQFFHYLPFTTYEYNAYSISNYPKFKEKKPAGKTEFWRQANDSALYNVQRQLEENISEVTILAQYKLNSENKRLMIAQIKDSAEVNEALKYLADSILPVGSYKIYKLRDSISDLAKELFGNLFKSKGKYAFVYNNCLGLAPDLVSADYSLKSMQNNSSLSQNEIFMQYARENLMEGFNCQKYVSISKNKKCIQDFLPLLPDSLLNQLQKVSELSLNISNYKQLLKFRLSVKYQQNVQNKESPGLWTFDADTVLLRRPFLFSNHKTGENEIVILDEAKNLYLVNATGNALWKVKVNEVPISEFYEVDAFKNNKLQLLFASANYLHLIDRNGKYVEGFPIKFNSEIKSAAVFDYEKTRDFRIILSTSDNKICNYNANGTKNDKFSIIRTLNNVVIPVQYIKVGASDYLVSCDDEGKIYIYSRRGEGRIDLTNRMLANIEKYHIEAGNNIQTTRLVYFDGKNSLLEKISFDDKKDILKLGADFESPQHFYELIDDDKKTDIVILDKKKLICYDFTGVELFRFESEEEAYTCASYHYDDEGATFLLNSVNGQIHVLNVSDKKVTKKISGTSEPLLCDLFKDGKKYIVAGDGKELKCVLLK